MVDSVGFLFVFVFLLGLCWGSFLNVVAYRLAFNKPFFTNRSCCTVCDTVISWYDNIPVLSWFLLGGKCRSCKEKISVIYPIFELFTAVIFTLMFLKIWPQYSPNFYLSLVSHILFLSALIASMISDLRAMVIPQLFTIWLVPFGIIFSYLGLTPVSCKMSLLGAIFGYGILWLVASLFKFFAKKDGLGVGDMELLCLVGAFLGPIGAWFSLMIGSLSGVLIGGLYLLLSGKGRFTQIPFGPFLSIGALLYYFYGQPILTLIYFNNLI